MKKSHLASNRRCVALTRMLLSLFLRLTITVVRAPLSPCCCPLSLPFHLTHFLGGGGSCSCVFFCFFCSHLLCLSLCVFVGALVCFRCLRSSGVIYVPLRLVCSCTHVSPFVYLYPSRRWASDFLLVQSLSLFLLTS